MLVYRRTVRAVSDKIAAAIDLSVEALREGRVEQEPAMTDRMLGAIEQGIRSSIRGITWSAKTLSDRGPSSQESRFGADFMGVLQVDLPDYKVAKGFLAQAKMIKRSSKSDMKELKKQCERMLKLSPDSFVFIYSDSGVRVVPAIAVLATESKISELYSRSAKRFFEDHLECFIGDRPIQCPSPDNLDALREQFEARTALRLSASKKDGCDSTAMRGL